MLSLHDPASRAEALRLPLGPTLRDLIKTALNRAESNELLDLTHILVIQAGDTEADVIEALSWSPLRDPLSGARFGTKGFEPFWDYLTKANGWYQLINCIGNDGFAAVLFVEDTESTLPELLTLCRTHCGEGQP